MILAPMPASLLRMRAMRPSQNCGLHHVALRVDDIAAVRHFYVDLLGFAVEREIPHEELWLTTGTDSLVFLRASPTKPVGKPDHIGVFVPSAADVARWETYLRSHHVPISEPTEAYDDGSVGLISHDPAGHAVQIIWHQGVRLAAVTHQ